MRLLLSRLTVRMHAMWAGCPRDRGATLQSLVIARRLVFALTYRRCGAAEPHEEAYGPPAGARLVVNAGDGAEAGSLPAVFAQPFLKRGGR